MYLAKPTDAAWERYREQYLAILRDRFETRRAEFEKLAQDARGRDVYLGCWCPTSNNPNIYRCHTVLALRFMKQQFPDLDVRLPGLRTDRLFLRPLTSDDAGEKYAIDSDPDVSKWLGGTTSREQSLKSLNEAVEAFFRHGFGVLGICICEDEPIVGYCGVIRSEYDEGQDVEIICALRRNARGKGLGQAAARAVLRWGFDALRRPRILARVAASNERGDVLAKRLQMTEDGRRLDLLKDEEEVVYCLKSEQFIPWQRRKRQ